MKYLFAFLLCMHAGIHLMGFLKAFSIADVKGLTIPISKAAGSLWLIAALLTFTFAITYAQGRPWAGWVGLAAAILSQVLILSVWKEAKFGTLPNLLMLALSLSMLTRNRFDKMVKLETAGMMQEALASQGRALTESDLLPLPVPVQRWLRSCGMAGKPYVYAARIVQDAEMRMKPGQDKWMKAFAVQYSFTNPPAFIWKVNMRMNPLLSFEGRDKFAAGRGEMLIKLNGWLNMVNASGEKIDEGSLQRLLGEMVWLPSLAVHPSVSWEAVDDRTARATMEVNGTSGSGTFHYNEAGDFTRYSAMRFMGNEADATRREWILDVQSYAEFEGIRVPDRLTATWKLESGDWTWLKLQLRDIAYNERAQQLAAANGIPYHSHVNQ